MFSVGQRIRIQERVLELAAADPRIVAGAVVGSLALGEGDRWSDLDLAFGVADGVLRSARVGGLDAHVCRRVRRRAPVRSAQRRFHLPGLSAAWLPAVRPVVYAGSAVRRHVDPKFRLLFGSTVEETHFANRPRRMSCSAMPCTMRCAPASASNAADSGRPNTGSAARAIMRSAWRAAAAACRPCTAGALTTLPPDVRSAFMGALVTSLERAELLRALGAVIAGLLAEAEDVQELVTKVAPELHKLTAEWHA